MLRKLLSAVVAVLLVNLVCGMPVNAGTKPKDPAKFTAQVKASIAKIGTGQAATVQVKLRDQTKLKGYISEITDEHFVVIDCNTNVPTTVPYAAVKQVKGNNLSTGVKIGIAVAVIFVVAIITGFLGARE